MKHGSVFDHLVLRCAHIWGVSIDPLACKMPPYSRVLALNPPYHLPPDLLPHIKGSHELDYKESK